MNDTITRPARPILRLRVAHASPATAAQNAPDARPAPIPAPAVAPAPTAAQVAAPDQVAAPNAAKVTAPKSWRPSAANLHVVRHHLVLFKKPLPPFFDTYRGDGLPTPWPLALSTRSDLAAWAERHEFTPDEIAALADLIRVATQTIPYLKAVRADGAMRRDIHGVEVEPVSDQHRQDAERQIKGPKAKANAP